METTVGVLRVHVDLVCPWCRIGQARLDAALDRVRRERGNAAVPSVSYRPFQLQPDQPLKGVPRREHFTRAFGSWERADRAFAHVREVGAREGAPFRMDLITMEPNTIAAHVLLQWAQHPQDRQDGGAASGRRVARGLFDAFFVEGRDIGDKGVLVDVAAAAGLDRHGAEAELADPAARARVKAMADQARVDGVTAVPTYTLAGLTVAGALSSDHLYELLTGTDAAP